MDGEKGLGLGMAAGGQDCQKQEPIPIGGSGPVDAVEGHLQNMQVGGNWKLIDNWQWKKIIEEQNDSNWLC